jgi:plasmid stabilization system protein ParE
MALRWTSSANRDLVRLHAFLAPVDSRGAARGVQRILAGVRHIARHPRIGVRLSEFDPREVRSLIVGDYEIRYEVRDDMLVILRVWHAHEDR